MKTIKKIQWGTFIIFMLSLYVGFIYTLSMLTEVTQLNFFTDFLDQSVLVYVEEAQKVNQSLFNLSLIYILISTLLYAFKIGKKGINLKKTVIMTVIGIIATIIHIMSYVEMVALNKLYSVTNTSWPEGFPDLFGYEEPGNLFVGAGPQIYMWLTIISILFVLTMITTFIISQKEQAHETSK